MRTSPGPDSSALRDDPKAVFLTLLARELHRAGVASDQLEQTLGAAAGALGLQVEIFALPTNITIAIGPRYSQQVVMFRLQPGRVNLRKLALLNEVYDGLQTGAIDLPMAIDHLRQIDRRCPPPPVPTAIAANAVIALGVSIILGGGVNEMIVAASIGATTGVIAAIATRVAAVDRLFEVIAAFVGTLVVAGYTHFIAPANLYISIVSGVVVLLPGYSLTLALHELANQDLIAGTARLGRVLMILLALGCGALLGFAVAGPHFLGIAAVRPHPVSPVYWSAAVVLMSLGISVDLDARLRDFGWVFAASFLAIFSSKVFGALPFHQITAFAAAFVCGMVANLGARFLRVPQPVFLVPALIVLVPGSLSYESILYVFAHQNFNDAAALGVDAIVAGILIVAGLLLSQLLVPAHPLSMGRLPGGHGQR